MTPDEIQKDRAAGTSAFFEARQREVDRIKAAIEPSTYGGDKVDLATYAGHVVTLTAENAALREDIQTAMMAGHDLAKEEYRDAIRKLEAENAALKERVLVLTYALDIWEAAYSTGRNEPLVTASETGRAALEKSHE